MAHGVDNNCSSKTARPITTLNSGSSEAMTGSVTCSGAIEKTC